MKLTKIIPLISGLILGANANSLCGNGVKDAIEQCDPTDSTKNGWGNKGCSENCIIQTGPTCDKVFRNTLRHGRGYNFSNIFINNSNTPLKIQKAKLNFEERKDFNGAKTTPSFRSSDWIKNKSYIVNPFEQGLLLESITRYAVRYHPKYRQTNFVDIIIKYTTSMSKIINNQEKGYFIETTCDKYKITWCGDGIVDNYIETDGNHVLEFCDDGNSKSGDGCSSTCQLEN